MSYACNAYGMLFSGSAEGGVGVLRNRQRANRYSGTANRKVGMRRPAETVHEMLKTSPTGRRQQAYDMKRKRQEKVTGSGGVVFCATQRRPKRV